MKYNNVASDYFMLRKNDLIINFVFIKIKRAFNKCVSQNFVIKLG